MYSQVYGLFFIFYFPQVPQSMSCNTLDNLFSYLITCPIQTASPLVKKNILICRPLHLEARILDKVYR